MSPVERLFVGFIFVWGCKAPDSTPTTAVPSNTAAGTATAVPSTTAMPLGAARTWEFESDKPGGPPAGFSFGRTGQGAEGTWMVRAESGAPSGKNVLVQTNADTTDFRFPVAVADEPSLRDVDLQVRCKPISGTVDQACGLVFRYRDANNYYVTRANALESNVRLYYVKDGQRHQIASFSGKVAPNAWHDYRVVLVGDHMEVYWDGTKVIDQHDKTFGEAGKVGVWTKADSITYFDDLTVKPLS